jgi:hypothetical protein
MQPEEVAAAVPNPAAEVSKDIFTLRGYANYAAMILVVGAVEISVLEWGVRKIGLFDPPPTFATVGLILAMTLIMPIVRGVVRGDPRLIAVLTHTAQAMPAPASIVDFAGLLLPRRLANEELGDALEDIQARHERGEAEWRLYLIVLSAIFWAYWHAVWFGWRQFNAKSTERR